MNLLSEANRLVSDGIQNERDLAIGIECMQELHDRLEELEGSDLSVLFKEGVEIAVGGSVIHYKDRNELYEFLAGVMNK